MTTVFLRPIFEEIIPAGIKVTIEEKVKIMTAVPAILESKRILAL